MAKVLLIEDDDAQRFVAHFALDKAGHQVREAPDGPQGIAAAREERPDVIVCDVMMPGISGYEVVAQLRADPQLATVPVILLTAMSERRHMRQGMTAGADDYVTKPYKPEELCEAITAVLARRQVQEDAFRNSLSGMVESALQEQKETLGRQYEKRLQREINARWARAKAARDLHYPNALVLLADVLGTVGAQADTELAGRVKQAQQAARDTLYLFGADHVMPYGRLLMAVFSSDASSGPTPPELRVLRAAIALARAAPREQPVAVALHCGDVALVALSDALHGDQGHALVPGASVDTLAALEEFALASGWRMAASEPMARLLAAHASFGRRGATARGDAAVEITGAAAA